MEILHKLNNPGDTFGSRLKTLSLKLIGKCGFKVDRFSSVLCLTANMDKKVENINFNHKINISVSESFEVDAQMRINHFESS